MTTIKGPGIFLAQFLDDKAPFNDIFTIAQWAKNLGYKGIQIPTWDARCINLQLAAESKTYADEFKGKLNEIGVKVDKYPTGATGFQVVISGVFGNAVRVA